MTTQAGNDAGLSGRGARRAAAARDGPPRRGDRRGDDSAFLASLPGAPDLTSLTWGAFLLDNVLPVTIGNLIGGTVMVGAVYWLVYLRGERAPRA